MFLIYYLSLYLPNRLDFHTIYCVPGELKLHKVGITAILALIFQTSYAMFAADLSWKETTEEKIGERRQRKARQASTTPAGNTSSSSGPSSVSSGQPGDRSNNTRS